MLGFGRRERGAVGGVGWELNDGGCTRVVVFMLFLGFG